VCVCVCMGSDSLVGITASYRLDCWGLQGQTIFSFPYPPRPTMRPTQPPLQWVSELLVRSNAPGAWCCLPNPTEGENKHERSYTSTPPLLHSCFLGSWVVLIFYFRVYERTVALTGLSVCEDT